MTSYKLQSYRRSALKKQGGFCFWCGVQMLHFSEVRDQAHPRLVTAEHLVPKSAGGQNIKENIVASCFKCNGVRKDNPLDVWLHRVKFRLKQSGNPEWFEVILSELKVRGMSEPSVGQPGNGPDAKDRATSPPPKV